MSSKRIGKTLLNWKWLMVYVSYPEREPDNVKQVTRDGAEIYELMEKNNSGCRLVMEGSKKIKEE